MFSYLAFTYFLYEMLASASEKNHGLKNFEEIISRIAESLVLSTVLISGILIFQARLGFGGLPLLLALSPILASIGLYKREKLLNLSNLDLRKELNVKNQKSHIYIVLGLLAISLLMSIGPINHPDAADYHSGYPWLYTQSNSIIIDEGLHQGLLGFGDILHMAYFQEKSTWMIRSIQFLPLPLVAILFLRKQTEPYVIYSILTTPVLVQWLTIGKPLFLISACYSLAYICWLETKSIPSLRRLLTIIAVAALFKISEVITILPILIHCIVYLTKNPHKKGELCNELQQPKNLLVLILLTASIVLLMHLRIEATGNPIYPLMSKLLTSDNWQFIDFEESLKNYRIDDFFPISIFVSLSPKTAGITLGLPVLICFFASCTNIKIDSQDKVLSATKKIGLAILILTLIFSQKRADYYAPAIIILLYGIQLRLKYKPLLLKSFILLLGFKLHYS